MGAPDPGPEPSTKLGVGFLHYGNGEPPVSHLAEFDVWVTSMGGAPAAGANPSAKCVLEYFSAITCSQVWANEISPEEARALGAVLKDPNGSELTNTQYGGVIADPGHVGYQQAWAQQTEARMRANGVDGCFVDDVQRTTQAIAGKMSAKYPTWQQYEAAQVSMFAYVGQYLRSKGFRVVVNATGYIPGFEDSNSGKSDYDFWAKLAPHVSGLNAEYWMARDNFPGGWNVRREGPEWWNNWSGFLRLAELCEAQGIDFYNLNYSPNALHRDYSLCSLLLETRGTFVITDDSNLWTGICEKAKSLGNATAAKAKSGNRWQRQYEGGLVWVDPIAGTCGII